MDKEYFMSCSYNDLKKIALEHDIFKSIKSKKKDVLLEKLVDYFADNIGDRREMFVVSPKKDVKEVSDLPKKSTKGRKGKKTKSKEIQIGSSEDEISNENQYLQEMSSRRGTFVIPKNGTISVKEFSELPKKSNKGRKGKGTRSKDVQISEDEISFEKSEVNQELQDFKNRRGTFVISKKSAISDDEVLELPKKSNKGKRARSKDIQISEDEISDEAIEKNQDLQEITSRRGTFVISKKGPISDVEVSELPKKSYKGRIGKRTRSKDIQISEDEISDETNQNLQETANRRGTFVSQKRDTDIVKEISDLPKKSNKGRKGKKTKSKDIQIMKSEDDIAKETNIEENLNLLGHKIKRTRSKDNHTKNSEDDIIEERSVEENLNLPVHAGRKENLPVSTDINTVTVEETSKPPKMSYKGRKGKKTRSKDMKIRSSEDESDELTKFDVNQDSQANNEINDATYINEKSSSSEKSNKLTRGRRVRSKAVIEASSEDSDLNRTFVLSEINQNETSEAKSSSDQEVELPKNKKSKRGNKNKAKNDSNADSVIANENIPHDLPKGPVPITRRRGTFSVTTSEPSENVTDEVELNGNILRSQEKKRKQSDSEESFLKENVDGKSTSGNESSPKKPKKVGIVAPVTSFLMNKAVHFITPESSRKQTPNKNNVTLTPHPIKKLVNTPSSKRSISSPLSVKKTPGQFSAKKMPNFAKIHKKNFEKMESLLAYSERKNVQRELLSPLNKTFTGLSVKEKILKKPRNSTGRQPVKSLIPVRSNIIRLENKEKITAFAKKSHVPNIEAMREKERSLIKGVRANKRFMLQMKMRKIDS